MQNVREEDKNTVRQKSKENGPIYSFLLLASLWLSLGFLGVLVVYSFWIFVVVHG